MAESGVSTSAARPADPTAIGPFKAHMINDINLDQVQSHCRKWATQAKTKKLVVMFEGLMVYGAKHVEAAYRYQHCLRQDQPNCVPLATVGITATTIGQAYMTRNVLSPLIQHCAQDFEFIVLGHDKEKTADRELDDTRAVVCIKEFLSVNPQTQILLAGHSLGGPAAAILGEKLEKHAPKANFNTILVDSVKRGKLGFGDSDNLDGSQVTPGRSFTHFFQTQQTFPITTFVPGEGNDIITKVSGESVNHITVLQQPKVLKKFKEFCN